jgi:hypothetical protein
MDMAKELDDMASHEELNQAAQAVRARMEALRAQHDSEAGQPGQQLLRRSQSLSQAERHMSDFDRLVKVNCCCACAVWPVGEVGI